MKYQLFKDRRGKWRWRAKAKNGRIVACSGECFWKKGNARRAVETFHQRTYEAEVTDEVMDSAWGAIFDEAENRLHAQKGVMAAIIP